MVTLKQEKLFYHIKIKLLLKLRWLLTIGVFTLGINCFAQRANMWLFANTPVYNDEPDSVYCIDFNYCPPQYKKMYLEKDIYLRKIHTKNSTIYFPYLLNNFCDTSGQIAFTELLGQHYYNKWGELYDSTYIENSYFKYLSNELGQFLSKTDRSYYFKLFLRINTEFSFSKPVMPDSFFVCVSEFTNDGNLVSKNKVIYKDKYYGGNTQGLMPELISGKLIDEQNAEIIFTTNSRKANKVINYNFNTKSLTFKNSLSLDSLSVIKYSTLKNKLVVRTWEINKLYLYEDDGKSNYKVIVSMDLSRIPTPSSGYKVVGLRGFCFSPNDSILFLTTGFKKDTTSGNIPQDDYLLAINYSKGYNDYKFFKLRNGRDPSPGNNYGGYDIKLGPDGNIYLSNQGRVKSKYRIIHPNRIKDLKLESLPEIKTLKYPYNPNYSLYISTLEDYKKTEFTWKPSCDSLKVRFTNTCDTQYFKRYRLFFDNGDSIDLGKNWNTKIYNYPKEGKYYVRLKAFSKGGGFIWYGDSIEIHAPPVAKFGIQKTKGCQWIGYGFTDSSQLFSIKPGFKAYKYWNFGDGKDSIDASTNPKLTYTYTTSNTFTVKLVVNNGYCTDTAIQLNNVVILPAPKPGITATPLSGCTPLNVNFKYKYSDVLDSAVWRNGSFIKAKGIIGSFTYNQIGNYFLSQKLYGPSGCITTDSVLIKVSPGISGMPDILNATVVNENSIDLKWKKHLNAVSYSIIKNNNFLARTTDTSYTDKNANTMMPNSYTIKAISICNDSSTIQDLAQTIYLKADRTENNEAKLNWTAYQRWDMGVNSYQIFTQNESGYFELMATLNGQTLEYLDESFAGISEPQKCYKIIADEKDGNLQLSASNIYCLPLKPILFIPSAFSPNGDGVNDTWKISYKGIKEANIKIFNRWGENVYQYTNEKPEWDGKYKGLFVPNGTYFYQIEATGIKQGIIYKSGVVEVVR